MCERKPSNGCKYHLISIQYLKACIHFHEIELIGLKKEVNLLIPPNCRISGRAGDLAIEDELDGAGASVPHRTRCIRRGVSHFTPQTVREARGGRLCSSTLSDLHIKGKSFFLHTFNDLLISSLNRAVSVPEIDVVVVLIAKHL